jgi:hypothetical protein
LPPEAEKIADPTVDRRLIVPKDVGKDRPVALGNVECLELF